MQINILIHKEFSFLMGLVCCHASGLQPLSRPNFTQELVHWHNGTATSIPICACIFESLDTLRFSAYEKEVGTLPNLGLSIACTAALF